MKLLKEQFDRDKFTHRQIARSEKVAVYERRKIGGNAIHFEVVKPRANPAHDGYKLGDKDVPAAPAKESYPSAEDWGTHGFTFNTREAAMAKFNELSSNV